MCQRIGQVVIAEREDAQAPGHLEDDDPDHPGDQASRQRMEPLRNDGRFARAARRSNVARW